MTKKPTYEELEQNLKRVEYEFQKDRDDRERLIEEHTNRWRRSEARLQNLMETVPIGISISTSGTNGIVTEINSALFKIFGYSSKEEFLKIPASAHYYNSKDRKTFSDLHKDGPVINYETRFKRKDGTVFWGSICSGVCPTEDGNFEFYNTFEDITKQKQAEDKLLESEAGLSKAQQMVHIGNWNWNIVENKILWSDELYRIIGLSPQQFDATYEAYLQCIHPDDLEFFKNLTRKILRDKKPYTAEHRIVRPNGDVRTVQVLCEINVDTNGDPIDLFGTMQDITERKHKEEQYRTIIQTAIDGFLIVDNQGHLLDVNNAMGAMLGYRRDELLQMNFSDFEVVETPDEIASHIKKIINQGYDCFETRYRCKDGTIIDVENNIKYMDFKNGLFIAFIRDITKKKQIEQDLRESEERYRTVADFTYDWESWIGPDGKYLYVSPSFERITGYAPDKLFNDHRFIETIIHPEDRKQFSEQLHNHSNRTEALDIKFRIIARNGDTRWISHICQPVHDSEGHWLGRRASNRDITEQKKIEEQFRQAQKMEAIGTLAGGVAHDFNNILSIIIGYAEIALMDVIKDESLRLRIEGIKAAGEKAASLTRQLLAFSRKQVIKPEVLDLNEVINETEKMLKRMIGEDIEIQTILEPELWKVRMDSGQVDQIIINMAVNARDAMPNGGKLIVETANVNLDENYFRKHGIEKEPIGSYVMIAVSDTGIGMDKETREHIFEPFYTTKEIGKGTGLGLSTVYGIAKQNNGFIWVYSEPGQGTTFKVYLSRAKGDAKSEKNERLPVIDLNGSETVLIVEDDDSLREFVRTVFKQRGYKVLEAENGEDALRVSKGYAGSIDLLLTDVVMPKMNGRESAERLQPLYPHMKVIYMSGYTDNAIAHHGVLEPGLNFIEKPFTPESLARKVREVLDEAKSSVHD